MNTSPRPMPTASPGAPAAPRRRRRRDRKRLRTRIEKSFFGMALAAFGVVAWGFRQEQVWAEGLLDWWPVLLLWLGLGDLLARRFVTGIGLITGGGLALLHLRDVADFDYTWPLIPLAMGVVLTLGALAADDGPLATPVSAAEQGAEGDPSDPSDPQEVRRDPA